MKRLFGSDGFFFVQRICGSGSIEYRTDIRQLCYKKQNVRPLWNAVRAAKARFNSKGKTLMLFEHQANAFEPRTSTEVGIRN